MSFASARIEIPRAAAWSDDSVIVHSSTDCHAVQDSQLFQLEKEGTYRHTQRRGELREGEVLLDVEDGARVENEHISRISTAPPPNLVIHDRSALCSVLLQGAEKAGPKGVDGKSWEDLPIKLLAQTVEAIALCRGNARAGIQSLMRRRRNCWVVARKQTRFS